MRVIAHLTDLSGDDRPAFVHAAALAAACGARLVTVHGTTPSEEGTGLPEAAPLAQRWGRAIEHWRMCHQDGLYVAHGLLEALRPIEPSLVVVGTHARRGLDALFHDSVSESLARHLTVPTLVVPNAGRGFVDEAAGVIDLHRVVVPAADGATAARGLAAARELLAMAGVRGAELVVLTVGDHVLEIPLGDVRGVRVSGPIDDAIVVAAAEQYSSLIVMPTSGPNSADVFFGSHTEHVIRGAGRPVLAVPPARDAA